MDIFISLFIYLYLYIFVSLFIIKRIYGENNITMAMSLRILKFEPFIMEEGQKLNLGIRWKKYLTKFKKLECCYISEKIIYEILLTMFCLKQRVITQPLNI